MSLESSQVTTVAARCTGLRRLLAASITLVFGILICPSGCGPQASTSEAVIATTQPIAAPRDVPGIANFARVSDVLYRGAQPSAVGFQTLKQMGIRSVVDLRGKIHHDPLEGTGLRALQLPSSASHPNEQQVIEFLRWVRDPPNQPVFVHGELGGTRTGCYVAAYRMVEQGWTAPDAEAELRRFRFDPYWKAVPAFLNHLEVSRIRRELNEPPSTEPDD